MNSVSLIGRLTRDPEVRYKDDLAVARFTVAVDRPTKDKTSDFPSVIAFGKTAEIVEKYLAKGSQVGISGRIQTGSYTNKDGVKVYTTDVVAERVEFLGKKEEKPVETVEKTPEGFEQISADEIPF
jgi:single-strand DNA-binding protein